MAYLRLLMVGSTAYLTMAAYVSFPRGIGRSLYYLCQAHLVVSLLLMAGSRWRGNVSVGLLPPSIDIYRVSSPIYLTLNIYNFIQLALIHSSWD